MCVQMIEKGRDIPAMITDADAAQSPILLQMLEVGRKQLSTTMSPCLGGC